MLMRVMLTNTYDPERIRSRRIKAVVKRCTAFDPEKRYKDVRTLKNRVKLCADLPTLLSSLRALDTNIYVFANSRLKIGRIVLPIAVLSFLIITLSFIQPYPLNGYTPKVSLLLFTITINPQWTANDVQYKIFFTIIFAASFTFLSYIIFAVYDVLRFYYLKALQRYYLKRNPSREFGAIPFVIASKRYVHCTLVIISVMGIICSIPFTDIWAKYDIHGFTILMVLISIIVSLLIRGACYQKYYNQAVCCYYKGYTEKAAKYAEKPLKCRRNHAKAGPILLKLT